MSRLDLRPSDPRGSGHVTASSWKEEQQRGVGLDSQTESTPGKNKSLNVEPFS